MPLSRLHPAPAGSPGRAAVSKARGPPASSASGAPEEPAARTCSAQCGAPLGGAPPPVPRSDWPARPRCPSDRRASGSAPCSAAPRAPNPIPGAGRGPGRHRLPSRYPPASPRCPSGADRRWHRAAPPPCRHRARPGACCTSHGVRSSIIPLPDEATGQRTRLAHAPAGRASVALRGRAPRACGLCRSRV